MRLCQNRVADDDLHANLLDSPLWASVWRGKLYAEIFLPEWLGVDDMDVPAYGYPVGKMVETFVADLCGPNGKFDRRDGELARALLADLEQMIAIVRKALPDTPGASGTLDPTARQWDGHKFGTWYPWPAQVPPTRDFYIVAYIGATGVARFKPNKAGNGGSWANGYSGHATTNLVRFWMPMPDMPNNRIANQTERENT